MICEDLKGRRALVKGAGSGIGSAAAVLFSGQDCYIGVHYFRTPGGAKKTLKQVKKNSDGILLCADIRDEKQVEQMVEQFADKAGGIDILINNGGLYMKA
jgi:3-oxoacyl-[acyl-carrier protein] reductase